MVALRDHRRESDTPPPVALYAAAVGFLFVGVGVVGFSIRLVLCIVGVSCG